MLFDEEMIGTLDLEAYFRRIQHRGRVDVSLACLEDLCRLHVGVIPFENLDPLAGKPVRLDLPSLQAKLVKGGRGGYCFEHNLLFAAVLTRLGFPVALREARVRLGLAPGVTLPRTHGVLEVQAGGEAWLADVGFGGEGLTGPVPLNGREIEREGELWRLTPEGAGLLLQADSGQGWRDFYAIQAGEVLPVDWAVANHYTSTHPESRFVRGLTVQLCRPGHRRILRNRTLLELRPGGAAQRELEPREVFRMVREDFGLDVSEALFDQFPKGWNETA